jgi:hypothetical protein
MKIQLEEGEIRIAAAIGVEKSIRAIRHGLQHRWGTPEDASMWHNNIEGAMGEIAVAKYRGIYWGGSLDSFLTLPDVGTNLLVRTRSKPIYQLFVRQHELHDNMIYVLVRGRCPNYEVIGYINGAAVKMPEYWDSSWNAYLIPDEVLNDFEE